MDIKFRILISGPPRHLAGTNSNRLPSEGFTEAKGSQITNLSPWATADVAMSN